MKHHLIKDRRELERNKAERTRITVLACAEALKLWGPSEHEATVAPMHVWSAGFIQGYLARKQERKTKP